MVKETKLHKRNILLVSAVLLLILIGLFRDQIRSISTILFGVTLDQAIRLTTNKEKTFNVLLMGIGGGNHEGPNLTDTIIFAHINVDKKEVSMFSIPRDFWVPDLEQKVNAAYQTGIDRDRGIPMVRETLEKITGQKIDYVAILDFAGFVKLVDRLGGITVDVTSPFMDKQYPIEGKENDTCGKPEEELPLLATASSELEAFPCRYKMLGFEMGVQEFDGKTALEFVRSRHGTNGEGSDFARSSRQQKVISAIKEKAFSLGVILNPVKVIDIFNILKDNIHTDVDIDKIDDFIKLARRLEEGQIKSYVIDDGDITKKRYGLLTSPQIGEEFGFRWVLTPRKGAKDFSEIQKYIACIIENKQCIVGKYDVYVPSPTPTIQKTTPR